MRITTTRELEESCKQIGAVDMLDRVHKRLSACVRFSLFRSSYVKYDDVQNIMRSELDRLKAER